uniref:Dual OB-containing domain-containing protein n=1 Tax=Candidatus Kentrum sp. SD TaxID=2126332 RepID=A0A450YE87_9GAMM|nr:MAG: hypothetical protein BECKSD772F_GA0070984_104810 [Candidatus Kentron sp. SD]VFK45295.1 MAG: hypothetical protein BECKSD772E_GA0070983_10519 [Candidatus Kentron sp. SD]
MADANGKELGNRHDEHMVKPLQKVKIELAKPAPLPNQPENFIVGGARWVPKGNIGAREIAGYLDQPETLWGIEWASQKGTADRVPFSQIENRDIEIAQSLYLVRVDDLQTYKDAWNKLRASFSYNGNAYDLSVTDPHADRHLQKTPRPGILCVSLGEEFNGYCYKIVAAIYWRE